MPGSSRLQVNVSRRRGRLLSAVPSSRSSHFPSEQRSTYPRRTALTLPGPGFATGFSSEVVRSHPGRRKPGDMAQFIGSYQQHEILPKPLGPVLGLELCDFEPLGEFRHIGWAD
jgi:hypothetical protein